MRYAIVFITGLLNVLLVEALFTALVYTQAHFSALAYLLDAVLLALLGVLAFSLMRPSRLSVVVAALLPAALDAALHRYNLMFAEPLSAYDLDWVLIADSLGYIPIADLITTGFVIACLAAVIRYRWQTLALAATFAGVSFVALTLSVSLYSTTELVDINRYTSIGKMAYLIQTLVERQTTADSLVTADPGLWRDHHDKIQYTASETLGEADRNVYIAVLESWADPRNLKIDDPESVMADTYRREIADHINHASASIAGGRTVNTEFEILCGVPSVQRVTRLDFMLLSRMGSADCALPAIGQAGYSVNAIHAGSPWGYDTARNYEAAGVDRMAFLDNDTPDNKTVATDRDLFIEGLLSQKQGPTLTYMMGVFGHHPFHDTPADDFPVPDAVTDAADSETDSRYLRQEYHRQKWIAEFIEEVKNEDPEALVIITGDHTPPDPSRSLIQDQWEVPFLVYDDGEFVEYDQTPALFNTHQVVFDRLSDGAFCQSMECFKTSDRSRESLVDRYRSFASNIVKKEG